jgi:hypothetical protein
MMNIWFIRRRFRTVGGLLVMLLVATLVQNVPATISGQEEQPPSLVWRDTGIHLPETLPNESYRLRERYCFDASSPGTLVISEDEGTVAYNWRTGQRTVITPRPFSQCDPDGLFFAQAESQAPWRFTTRDPQGQAIEHMPTHATADGTQQVYALEEGGLWASDDGGLTWHERVFPPLAEGETVANLVLAGSQGRALYALTQQKAFVSGEGYIHDYAIFFSPDGGATWEERFRDTIGPCFHTFVSIQRVPGEAVPETMLIATTWCSDHPGSGATPVDMQVSNDGARIFHRFGLAYPLRTPPVVAEVRYTTSGLLRFASATAPATAPATEQIEVSRSVDGGESWQPLSTIEGASSFSFVYTGGTSPAEIVLSTYSTLWYSADGGRSWQQAERREHLARAPYAPLTILGFHDNRLFKLDVQREVQEQEQVADERCFTETGHCIHGRIRAFWEQQGGLPVFGYPITPQREEMVEGHPVQVQWFERNRLELHPQNAPPYDVLSGRLGVDLLEQQGRDWRTFPTGEAQEGCRFIAETGHAVCGDILDTWRANGLELDGRPGTSEAESIALYGLPISSTQVEMVAGEQRTVQWFERARFELHPENEPPYHVLLGLLGNEVRAASKTSDTSDE